MPKASEQAKRTRELTVQIEDCYDPADYVMVHKDHLARLQRRPSAAGFDPKAPVTLSETIQWHRANDLPDDEITVLLYTPGLDEPVWLGWHDDEGWHAADAMPVPDEFVKAWAQMPSAGIP